MRTALASLKSRRLQMIFWSFTAITASRTSVAQTMVQSTANARWDFKDAPTLVINVSDLVTPSQRDIITSGFTTFTMLSVGEVKESSGTKTPLRRISCTVKYDTWEESYEVTRIDPPPPTTVNVKEYREWSKDCLEINFVDPRLLSELEKDGTLSATLTVRQSTADESARIKSWIVKQQSGFMQGLYSHMLGNFQYQNSTRIKVIIPKRPSRQDTNAGGRS